MISWRMVKRLFGLMEIVEKAGANTVGVGILAEKSSQMVVKLLEQKK